MSITSSEGDALRQYPGRCNRATTILAFKLSKNGPFCVLLVDDLIFIQGAVSSRVTLLLRAAEA